MIIGRIFCDKCGKDCTDLYGFALMTRGSIRNKNQQNELAEAKKKYGKDEFCFCWGCTAEAFGVKPLEVKKEPEQINSVTVDTAQTFVIEQSKDKKSPMRA
jgi:hypothetical protein